MVLPFLSADFAYNYPCIGPLLCWHSTWLQAIDPFFQIVSGQRKGVIIGKVYWIIDLIFH